LVSQIAETMKKNLLIPFTFLVLLASLKTAHSQTVTSVRSYFSEGEPGTTIVKSVKDGSGNIYVLGMFDQEERSGIDFDPSASVALAPLPAGATPTGVKALYLAKYSATGSLLWVRAAYGDGANDFLTATDLVLLSNGNIYLSGNVDGTVRFSTGYTTTGLGFQHGARPRGFVHGFTSSGAVATAFATPISNNSNLVIRALASDALNNIYTAGEYEGEVFDLPSSQGVRNAYFGRWSTAGANLGHVVIARTSVGSKAYDIYLDQSNGVYVVGSFTAFADFDPSAAANNLSYLGTNAFIAKYGADFSFKWARNTEFTGTDVGLSVKTVPGGNVSMLISNFDNGDYESYVYEYSASTGTLVGGTRLGFADKSFFVNDYAFAPNGDVYFVGSHKTDVNYRGYYIGKTYQNGEQAYLKRGSTSIFYNDFSQVSYASGTLEVIGRHGIATNRLFDADLTENGELKPPVGMFIASYTDDVTVPVKSQSIPQDNATNVNVNLGNVFITFNEEISYNPNHGAVTLALREASNPTPIKSIDLTNQTQRTLMFNGEDNQIKIFDLPVLGYNKNYYVEFTYSGESPFIDWVGNEVVPFTSSTLNFTTEAAPDTQAPTITSKSPPSAQTGVDIGLGTLSFTCNELLSLNPSAPVNYSLVIVSGAQIAHTIQASDITINGSTATIANIPNLNPLTIYGVHLPNNGPITDLSGNPINSHYSSWQFTTGPTESISPTLVSTFPAFSSNNVPYDLGTLTMTFSEPIQRRTAGGDTFRLRILGSNTQIAEFTLGSTLIINGDKVTMTGVPLLNPGVTYYIQSATLPFQDAAGNYWTNFNNGDWKFTVRSGSEIVTLTPNLSSTNVSTSTDLEVQFEDEIAFVPGVDQFLVIRRNGAVYLTFNVSDAAVSINGSTLNVNLPSIVANSNYDVQLGGLMRKDNGEPISQIKSSDWTFSTGVANNLPTNIALSAGTIVEGNAVGDVIGTLSSTDADGGDTHSYSFASGGVDNSSFTISGNQLKAATVFNLQAQSSYSIRLKTTDSQNGSFEKNFTITVSSSDVTPPATVSFSPLDNATGVALNADLVVTFNEPIAASSGYVRVMRVSDNALVMGGRPQFETTLFTISGATLTIHLANYNYLAPANNTSYFVELTNDAVKDVFNNTFSTGFADNETWSFTTVAAANIAPSNISLSANTINENNAIDAVIGTLSTTDTDAGDSHTYSLVAGTGSTDNASFNISGNQLRASVVFDYETKTSYSIRVRTNDGTATFEKQFTISINNLADNDVTPPFVLSFSPLDNATGVALDADLVVTFSETVQPYYSFVQVLRVGGGTPAASGYPITQTEQFTVSGNQLIIHLSNSVYALPAYNTEYYVRIDNGAVRDLAGNNFANGFGDSETWSFTTVVAPNAPPTDITLSASAINENNAINAVIGTLSTTDADAGDSHTYSLVSGSGSTDNGSFNINDNQLRASTVFDFETKTSYSIRVRTNDGTATFEKIFAININNLNEAPTDIALSANIINENNAVNAVIGALSSTDPDAGSSFTYSLVSGSGSTDNASFNISGNQLRASAVFNYETNTSYSIRVRTSDGTATFDKVFTINVSNVNEAPTNITLSANTIDENNAVNAVIGTLSSTDPDAGSSFTYSLVSGSGSTDNASFNISGNQLRASAAFNHEIVSSYSIRVRTSDGSVNFEKVFAILVNDVNEAPINYSLSSHVIDEGNEIGDVVGTFSTVDLDEGDSHTYSFQSGSGDMDNASFSIVGNLLKANIVFNYLVKSSHYVRVRSTDAGGLFVEQSLLITINSTDEQAPVITALSPANNATAVTLQPDLLITFDEEIQLNTSAGSAFFQIRTVSGNYQEQQIDWNSSNVEVVNGNQIRITGIEPLSANTEFWIRAYSLDNVFVTDASGNGLAPWNNDNTFWRFTTDKLAQTITFPAIADKTFGDAAFPLNAEASSSLAVSYNVIEGNATVLNGVLTITGAGEVTVRATQAGDGEYKAAVAVERTFTVAKAAQTISADPISNKTITDIPFAVSATVGSGLLLTYTVSGPATNAGNQITLTGVAGEVTVIISQTGNANYLAAENAVLTFLVTDPTKTDQTITFAAIADQTYGGTIALDATASSGLSVAYEVVDGPATFNGTALTLTGLGSVTVRATQAGDDDYNPAAQVSRSFEVGKAMLTVTAENKQMTYGSTLPDFTYTVTGFVNRETADVIAGGIEATTEASASSDAGEYTITVSGGTADNYELSYVNGTLSVTKATQTITFEAIDSQVLSTGSLTLSATASSGLAVSYEVSGPATLEGMTLTFTGAGDITVTASQAGNVNYMAAVALPRTFTVTDDTPVDPVKEDQTITFEGIADKTFGDAAFDLTATASSGLTVSYIVSGAATISGSTVTITGAGGVTITASQAGDDSFNAAADVSQSFTVNKATATVTLSDLEQEADGTPKTPTVVTDPSGLEVVFTFNGETIIPVAAGSYTVVATIQDANYQGSAEAVFEMTEVVETGVADEMSQVLVYPNPFAETINIEGKNLSVIRLHNLNGQLMLERAVTDKTELTTPDLIPGVYLLYLIDGEGRSNVRRMVKK
jgi:mRNA-degrading endonuclease HigB of HigAB toxin-antitoxin module